jgi:hypothetical protein
MNYAFHADVSAVHALPQDPTVYILWNVKHCLVSPSPVCAQPSWHPFGTSVARAKSDDGFLEGDLNVILRLHDDADGANRGPQGLN